MVDHEYAKFFQASATGHVLTLLDVGSGEDQKAALGHLTTKLCSTLPSLLWTDSRTPLFRKGGNIALSLPIIMLDNPQVQLGDYGLKDELLEVYKATYGRVYALATRQDIKGDVYLTLPSQLAYQPAIMTIALCAAAQAHCEHSVPTILMVQAPMPSLDFAAILRPVARTIGLLDTASVSWLVVNPSGKLSLPATAVTNQLEYELQSGHYLSSGYWEAGGSQSPQ